MRRNPRLIDFETLSMATQDLAMTAWIWGNEPKDKKKTFAVRLFQDINTDIRHNFIVKTTRLSDLEEKKDFDVETFFENTKDKIVSTDIFSLYNKLQKQENEIQSLCYGYTRDNIQNWMRFCENIDTVKKKHNEYICNYEQSMKEDKATSFPITSVYWDNDHKTTVKNWIWIKKDNKRFAFDSEAECLWADILSEVAEQNGTAADSSNDDGEKRFLWGKNFPYNSDIKYEYYNNGIHCSYPDFILKDKKGRIHIFEVKSVNKSNNQDIDTTEYEEKIRHLKECYLYASRLLDNHIFYLPVLSGETWQITKYENGNICTLSENGFKQSFQQPL